VPVPLVSDAGGKGGFTNAQGVDVPRWVTDLALDLLWADPATREQSASGLLIVKGGGDGSTSSISSASGDGKSDSSGSGTCSRSSDNGFLHAADPKLTTCADRSLHPRWLSFGLAATKKFCKEHGITHVLRGHSVKVGAC
jgi:hypothetical protein